MSAHKNIDRICAFVVALTVILSVVFCCGKSLGIETNAQAEGYEARLFDKSKVHTLDIVMNDWDSFIETCENEEYSPCNLVIDGEAVKNVGIRGKGNTSLSSVKSMDSSRYSFKIEFDQYEKGKNYYGLDKLCLNNIIQDNTYMKDYLAYTLMYDFGVDSPLCSYVYITVNGEDWGLYLAVEAIEDSFLERNYGSNYGDLYKPDSMSFGGGRGNGRDFSMGGFMENFSENEDGENEEGKQASDNTGGFDPSQMFGGEMPDMGDFDPSQMFGGEMPDMGDFDPSQMFGGEMPDMGDFDPSQMFGGGDGEKGGFGGFGMGSSDVKLQYTDDDEGSYSNIFGNAKTAIDTADKKRLIRSLKSLTEGTDIESVVDVDEVLRYFVVHDFLVNGDSYTGQMIHNYYLYEEDGQLSMIPWDYNLAFGSFMGGQASSSVNSPIDTPVSGGMSDRPMVAWIFDSEEYTQQYHELFGEFIEQVDFEKLVNDTADMIREYVEKDPTKFCTYEEFEKGVEAMSQFCTLREESVKGQLDGTIPSTTEGQNADKSALVDASGLNTSDMGSMGGNGGFGGGPGGNNPFAGSDDSQEEKAEVSGTRETANSGNSVNSQQLNKKSFDPENMPEDFDPKNMPSDFKSGDMPEGFDPGNMPSDFKPGDMPEGFDPENMPSDFKPGDMPEGFDPGNMPSDFKPTDKTEEADTTLSASEEPTESSTLAEDTESKSAEEKSSDPNTQNNEQTGRPDRPDRPGGENDPTRRSANGGNFPSMDSTEQGGSEKQFILLGVSAGVLLFGLIFAVRFRR